MVNTLVIVTLSIETAMLAGLAWLLIFRRHWLGIRPRPTGAEKNAAEYERRKDLRERGLAG